MIRDRYPEENLLALLPEHLQHHDPELGVLDTLLEDEVLFCQVKADLSQRHPHSATRGRSSTPVEVVLRMLVLRRLYDWSYEDTVWYIADSLSLRQFCHLGSQVIPSDTTLIRWNQCIRPETMAALNARVVQLACQRKVTRGRKLRVDGTVVETMIHHPSDSSLLTDGVRMLSRLVGRAKDQVPDLGARLVRNRTRSARRLGRQIADALRTGEAVRQGLYRRLLAVTRATVRQARQVAERLSTKERLQKRLDALATLTEQVIEQTTRRVLRGEQVPAREKIVSLVEPHTAILQRGKAGKATEYGHRVILSESDGGIITAYERLPSTEPEAPQLVGQVRQHQQHTGRIPHLVATDRGFDAPDQQETLEQLGVKQVAIPRRGKSPPPVERTTWFRRGRRFRAGIEGRISVAKRRGWLGRCRDHGEDGYDRWIGWGILSANLTTIARYQDMNRPMRAA